MRTLIIATAIATLAGAAMAHAEPQRTARAPSVERFAVQASYTAPAERIGQGYSLQARRIADCLADQANRTAAVRSPAVLERRCDI
ncbi:hypothetical protein [Phenylobacterium immobile]|uniref:hypothetical protein n=1 Tax=Phenylobacterium immobile TaxID=21 RepID=UPI000AF5F58F|nr:hypothetical protein [Phenylobacterium immobile]